MLEQYIYRLSKICYTMDSCESEGSKAKKPKVESPKAKG